MNPIAPIATSLTPIDRVAPTAPPRPPQAAAPTSGASASASVDTIPSSPPDEVLDAVGAASNSYDELAAQGKHVGFQLSDSGGRVQVTVNDLQGKQISPPLAPSTTFDILDGTA